MAFEYSETSYNNISPTKILPLIIDLVAPKSFLDVGCGNGLWLNEANKLGIKDCFGVDGEHINKENFNFDISCFNSKNLENPFDLNKKYDLVLSLEVAEHISNNASEVFVDNLIKHGNTIMFSAAIPNQGGYLHVNEQYPSFWKALFEKRGFYFYDIIRPTIWNDKSIKFWYRQNIFIIANKESIIAQKFQPSIVLDSIHPELYNFYVKHANRANKIEDGNAGITLSLKILLKSILKKLKK